MFPLVTMLIYTLRVMYSASRYVYLNLSIIANEHFNLISEPPIWPYNRNVTDRWPLSTGSDTGIGSL